MRGEGALVQNQAAEGRIDAGNKQNRNANNCTTHKAISKK